MRAGFLTLLIGLKGLNSYLTIIPLNSQCAAYFMPA